MAYPKCKSGYSTSGYYVCQPATPNCGALGYNGGISFTCAKHIIVGVITSPICWYSAYNIMNLVDYCFLYYTVIKLV